MENLSDEEKERFGPLANTLIDEFINVELHNKFFDEFLEELDVEICEDEIPDELLGVRPGDPLFSDKLKNRFVEIYELVFDDMKIAKKAFKEFENEARDLPAVSFLELQILQLDKPSKYAKLLSEYVKKFPDYQLLKVLWATEQITTNKQFHQIDGYPFKLRTFYPGRQTIHPIERYSALLFYVFALGVEMDINKIEAFGSVINDLYLTEAEESGIGAIILILKVNYLLIHLTKS